MDQVAARGRTRERQIVFVPRWSVGRNKRPRAPFRLQVHTSEGVLRLLRTGELAMNPNGDRRGYAQHHGRGVDRRSAHVEVEAPECLLDAVARQVQRVVPVWQGARHRVPPLVEAERVACRQIGGPNLDVDALAGRSGDRHRNRVVPGQAQMQIGLSGIAVVKMQEGCGGKRRRVAKEDGRVLLRHGGFGGQRGLVPPPLRRHHRVLSRVQVAEVEAAISPGTLRARCGPAALAIGHGPGEQHDVDALWAVIPESERPPSDRRGRHKLQPGSTGCTRERHADRAFRGKVAGPLEVEKNL